MSVKASPSLVIIAVAALLGGPRISLAACQNPGKLPVDIRDCGAQPQGDPAVTTTAINSALAAGDTILIPPGTWNVNEIVIPAGKTVVTGGLSTILQKSDLVDAAIIQVAGSNVRVDSFSAIGQLAHYQSGGTSPEHSPALEILGSSAISNVTLGDINGKNLSGDVLYIVGPVSNVTFGTITGTNIFRSMTSIVGGTDITGIAIIGGNCGYTTLDIEPNKGGQAADRIAIGLVRGGKIQLASGDPTIVNGTVDIDTVDLNSDLQTPPNPPYNPGGVPKFDTDIGILASFWTILRINTYHATKKHWSAFFSSAWGTQQSGSVEIRNYVGAQNGDGNQQYGEFNCVGCNRLKIDSGSTQLYGNGKPLFTGGVATVYELENFTLSNGGLGAYVTQGIFRNLTIDATNVNYMMSSVQKTVFQNTTVTQASPNSAFFYSSVDNVIVDSDLSKIHLQAGSSSNNTLIRTPSMP